MKERPRKIMCDCGHLESEHSECTRGYATDRETGETVCYNCALAGDLEYLKKYGKLSAYVSGDYKHVTA